MKEITDKEAEQALKTIHDYCISKDRGCDGYIVDELCDCCFQICPLDWNVKNE